MIFQTVFHNYMEYFMFCVCNGISSREQYSCLHCMTVLRSGRSQCHCIEVRHFTASDETDASTTGLLLAING